MGGVVGAGIEIDASRERSRDVEVADRIDDEIVAAIGFRSADALGPRIRSARGKLRDERVRAPLGFDRGGCAARIEVGRAGEGAGGVYIPARIEGDVPSFVIP